jgi:hypothetical protein
LKHYNAFMILPSHISKWSKLSTCIPACNKAFIPNCGIVAFRWVYKRNKFLILVVRCFMKFCILDKITGT